MKTRFTQLLVVTVLLLMIGQVAVYALSDVVTITTAEYRVGKQRLSITATSSVISPGVVLTLQPYLTANGTTFNPAVLGNTFTNTGGGIHTIVLVGAPPPACNPPGGVFATPCALTPLTVKSNQGGTSPATALTRIR